METLLDCTPKLIEQANQAIMNEMLDIHKAACGRDKAYELLWDENGTRFAMMAMLQERIESPDYATFIVTTEIDGKETVVGWLCMSLFVGQQAIGNFGQHKTDGAEWNASAVLLLDEIRLNGIEIGVRDQEDWQTARHTSNGDDDQRKALGCYGSTSAQSAVSEARIKKESPRFKEKQGEEERRTNKDPPTGQEETTAMRLEMAELLIDHDNQMQAEHLPPNRLIINTLVVDPQYQNHGIGEKLLETAKIIRHSYGDDPKDLPPLWAQVPAKLRSWFEKRHFVKIETEVEVDFEDDAPWPAGMKGEEVPRSLEWVYVLYGDEQVMDAWEVEIVERGRDRDGEVVGEGEGEGAGEEVVGRGDEIEKEIDKEAEDLQRKLASIRLDGAVSESEVGSEREGEDQEFLSEGEDEDIGGGKSGD